MFDIAWTELLVIAVIAILVVGPKDLPRALRAVGRWTGKVKQMAREFQSQFNEALREAEIESVRKDIESVGKIDPLDDVRKEVAAADKSLKTAPEGLMTGKPAGEAKP
jgi:sec-independent protein translocase protein TatB